MRYSVPIKIRENMSKRKKSVSISLRAGLALARNKMM